MDKIEEFKYKETIRLCRYWKDEYEMKKDIAFSIENMFNNALEEFLDKNPSIKNKWIGFMENKAKQIENLIKEKYSESDEINEFIEKEEIIDVNVKQDNPKNKEIKRLYREIVKLTHPDKLHNHSEGDKDKRLKIYKESTTYYDKLDLSNIIYCADELSIKYDSSLIDLDIIKKDIELYKQKALMYEKSIYWKWYDENKDEKIISKYVTEYLQ